MSEVKASEGNAETKILPDKIIADALSHVGNDFTIPNTIDPKAAYMSGLPKNKQLAV